MNRRFLGLLIQIKVIFALTFVLPAFIGAEIFVLEAAQTKTKEKKSQPQKKTAVKGSKGTSPSKTYKKKTVKAAPNPDTDIPVIETEKIKAIPSESKSKKDEEIVTSFGRKTRIDFEDLLIEGQTKKADTVYLFERTESKINSLVKMRKDFRQEIMETYLE